MRNNVFTSLINIKRQPLMMIFIHSSGYITQILSLIVMCFYVYVAGRGIREVKYRESSDFKTWRSSIPKTLIFFHPKEYITV